MIEAARIGSGSIIVGIRPEVGGQIVSLVDAAGREYLSQGFPRPTGLDRGSSYVAGGLGGIDDCLPAISAGSYPDGPYAGTAIPDHGELWHRPWEVIASSDEAITLRATGLVLPFSIVRAMRVAGDSFIVTYELVNHGLLPLPLVWAAHALVEPTEGLEIELPGINVMSREIDNLGLAATFSWPRTGAHELAWWAAFPEGGFLKGFAPMPRDAIVGAVYHDRGTALEIQTHASWPLFVGVWINRMGFPASGPVAHIGLEPTFGSSDSLARSLADGSALQIEAGGVRSWSVHYRVGASGR